MILSLVDFSQVRMTRAVAPARLAGLSALLLIEVMALSLRFDTGSLAHGGRWWSDWLGELPQILRLGFVVGLAALAFGVAGWRETLGLISERGEWPCRSWLYLLGHLAAFAGFAALAVPILEGNPETQAYPGLQVVGWVLIGLASLALWVAASWAAGLWVLLTRRWASAFMGGLAVGMAAWGAGGATSMLWRSLGHATFWLTRGLLGLVFPEIICEPSRAIIGTPAFAVEIAPSCSGYEGIGLLWVFLAVFFVLFRKRLRFPRVLLLVPIGTAIVWFVNGLRIAALVAIGSWGAPALALGGFHSLAGWIGFNLVALGIVAVTHGSKWFARHEGPSSLDHDPNPTMPYLAPLLALVGTTMITGAIATGFDTLYPLRILAVAAVLWACRRSYEGLKWSWSWPSVAIGAVVYVIWIGLEPAPSPGAEFGATSTGLAAIPRGWALAWLAARTFGSVVTVPIAEELAFRGYLIRRLAASDFQEVPSGRFTPAALLGSSILFGALHQRWLAGSLAGLFYALALSRRGRVTDAVLAHATTNALIAATVLLAGRWALWA